MTFLEFEKPIEELHEQLSNLLQIQEKSDVPMGDKIRELKNKIKEKQKEIFLGLNGWEKVQLSRHPDRPYTLYYLDEMSDAFVELHGDRCYGDDKAIVGALCKVDDQNLMIIGHQKGINTKMRQYRNFGMANPEGYRKALRLMKLAEKFKVPIVTLIDTPGAYPGIEAEERGQGEAIARNLLEMVKLKVPVVCVVIGEGASGGALGIGVGDRILMMENTWYSVISPESCSSILWRSWDYKEQAAEALKLTSAHMHKFKIIDGIIREPLGGAHYKREEAARILKRHILKHVTELNEMTPEERIDRRIKKYSSIGFYEAQGA